MVENKQGGGGETGAANCPVVAEQTDATLKLYFKWRHRVARANGSLVIFFFSRLSTFRLKPSAWPRQWPEPLFAVNQGVGNCAAVVAPFSVENNNKDNNLITWKYILAVLTAPFTKSMFFFKQRIKTLKIRFRKAVTKSICMYTETLESTLAWPYVALVLLLEGGKGAKAAKNVK